MPFNKGEVARLLRGMDLGSSVAEQDDLLQAARVETSVFADLLADRIDLVPGTKGSGKSALYRIFVSFLAPVLLANRKVVSADRSVVRAAISRSPIYYPVNRTVG